MDKKRGRPKLGPLVKYQRQLIRKSNRRQRGRPSFIPHSLLPRVIDIVALLMMESRERGRKITVESAVRRAVDMLVDEMSPDLLSWICKAAKVDYPGRGSLAEYRRMDLAANWLVTVNVEIKKLYGMKVRR